MEEKKELKYFVRIAQTDLEGNKPIGHSLMKIKGIGFMMANAVCNAIGMDQRKKTGYLNDDEVKKIDDVLKDPLKFNIPAWMFNRKNDPETGESHHIVTSNLIFAQENDIKMLKKMRSYKGIRHILGLPVRGQRTKANFRRNKGKVMGVKKKAEAKAGRT
ncbi:30S ribosomal protein S13 [Candidatus Woesearchaeota archaeon]|nr:30S ribosomal protein S13 [Candidatus Woesearchaeota archaeon]